MPHGSSRQRMRSTFQRACMHEIWFAPGENPSKQGTSQILPELVPRQWLKSPADATTGYELHSAGSQRGPIKVLSCPQVNTPCKKFLERDN
mmetsp:Transcript_19449/g.31599  ORF Transcript_19449/g.31599 Transcript_19449/m.31599 type:complete len:91 (+) Transcript_19449:771-1043(+)